ncbi:MAG: APC family permease, partial [Acidobacteria bacterium]
YAYVGFESAVIPAGETKNPERDLPRALLTSLLICTLIFVSVQFVAIGTFPGLASSERPLADAASVFMGSSGGFFIALGAVISILGNLNGGFLAASRLPFAMAEEDKLLPEILAKTHRRFQTPYISIILTSLPVLILTIQSSFLSALTMATVTRLVVYAITCVSLIILRQRKDVPEPQFKLKFGVVISLLSIVLIISLLTTIDSRELINLLISLLIGLIMYSTFKLLRSLKKY